MPSIRVSLRICHDPEGARPLLYHRRGRPEQNFLLLGQPLRCSTSEVDVRSWSGLVPGATTRAAHLRNRQKTAQILAATIDGGEAVVCGALVGQPHIQFPNIVPKQLQKFGCG